MPNSSPTPELPLELLELMGCHSKFFKASAIWILVPICFQVHVLLLLCSVLQMAELLKSSLVNWLPSSSANRKHWWDIKGWQERRGQGTLSVLSPSGSSSGYSFSLALTPSGWLSSVVPAPTYSSSCQVVQLLGSGTIASSSALPSQISDGALENLYLGTIHCCSLRLFLPKPPFSLLSALHFEGSPTVFSFLFHNYSP